MAMTYQNFASLGVNLNRQKYGPLDISNVFTSEADLKYYLSKGTFTTGVSEYWYKNANEKVVPYPYEGQVLATVIDGVVSVYALSLDAEGNFQTQEIGAKVEVDGKTIKLNAAGKLELVGLPADLAGKTLVPSLVNGELTWAEPDTSTAEGQAQEIEGLKTRATALEATVNGTGEGDEHVAGLVEKVAALEAVDNATQAELDAYKEVVTNAIAAGVKEAKDYADAQDADTIYDDTDLQNRVKAIEDDYLKEEDKYDDTEVKELIADLDTAIGDTTGGLVKDIADNKQAIANEKVRAEAAEKALGERIDNIDFIDKDELDAALEPINTALGTKAAQTDLEALEDRVDAFLTGTGATDALDSLQELIEYIDAHDGADLTEIIATINTLEGKLEGIDSTVVTYVTAAIDALKIGDYAKAADLTALARRVEALEAKPFDTYAIKSEVETAIATAKSEAISDAEGKLANKVDSTVFETFRGENTTAISTAKSEAIAAAAKSVEDAGYAVASDVAETYATKASLEEAVEGIENDLLVYAKTEDVNIALAKKIETGSIAHSSDTLAEGVTVDDTKLNIVVDAYTKQEVRDYVADVIEDMTGGESAADVLLALNNHIATYTEKVGQIDAKDNSQDTAIAKAQEDATKGINDAAAVAADLVTANTNISNNAREIETVKGTITTVNETLSSKITTLENKDVEIAGLISGLDTTVKSHTETIALHEGKFTTLENTDVALDTAVKANAAEIAKKANAADVYTKTEVDSTVTTINENINKKADVATTYTKTEVDELLANLDQTELENGIAANAVEIATLVGADKDAETGKATKSIRSIAKEEVALVIGAAPEALDTLEEVAAWIANDTTGAAAMAADIADHKAILSGFKAEDGTITTVQTAIATAKQEAIAAATYTLEVATADELGGIKSATGDNKVSVSSNGTASVDTVNVNTLTQTSGDVLILDGGNSIV